jgi:glycosyltransferase involved in cell wall biosynthesis
MPPFRSFAVISVIIPTYNRTDMLRESVQSVLDQDVFRDGSEPYELIVVDDGSEVETGRVLREFEGRLTYFAREHRGVSAARNFGLARSSGEMIAFLDSDDLWKPDKIRVQAGFMKTFPEAVACYTEEIWIRHGRRVNPHDKHRKYSGWIFDKVLPLCLLSLSSALFRSRVFDELGMFDEDLPVCEDYDFGIRLARKYPLHLIPRPLIEKRGGHPGQLSHEYWGMDRFRIAALEKALALDLTGEQRELVRREIIRKGRILAAGFSKRNKRPEARRYQAIIKKYETERREQ